ncbi:carboxypeptidase regulatory-like domain-containing protein [Roseofilum capinflatum]|uniref:Carboxypeptidase regulatory-like domain-containing protein n=1 Tax=Roseofilum capinflatum BLCC-M114 TaxID=3022440 RepID=A0ABT7B652_9CYAN|nr:carboxypeptidase regulatory-like domain-containing protein [Roseofilum capinflatum]MDJ1174645.1 carboxypeptidase regulatory-like domain-containing protein [Roseofilum capinflatum BLCC-M114]
MKKSIKVFKLIGCLQLIFLSECIGLPQATLAATMPTTALTESTPNSQQTLFIVGLTVGRRNVNAGVLVRGEVDDTEAINFDDWLVPYNAILEALNFTSEVVEEDTVELRSPFKVVQLNLNDLQTDPELGLVLSVAQMRELLAIPIEFDWREYAIVFQVPEVRNPRRTRRQDRQIVLEGLPQISAPNFNISGVQQEVNSTGIGENTINNRGQFSAVGTLFDSSWFLRLNQRDFSQSETWQLSELQFLRQRDSADYYLGSQPTFWRSQSGGEFWGFTTIQRRGYIPFPILRNNGGANPEQRLQPESVTATITGQAKPGTVVQLVNNLQTGELLAEQVVDDSGVYRFNAVRVGRSFDTQYYVLLYPNGSLAEEPIIEEARFSVLLEQLPAGTSAWVVSTGWKRQLNVDEFWGDFTDFNAGVTSRWGLSEDLTVGLGAFYDLGMNGLAEIFYQPKGTPFIASISGILGEETDIDINLVWDGYPNFLASLSSDFEDTRYSLDWKFLPQLRLIANGTFGDLGNFSLQYFSGGLNSSTLARLNVDTEGELSWNLNQQLGRLYLFHQGNKSSSLSDLSYQFTPSHHGVLNYRTLHGSRNDYLLSAFWRYRSPDRTYFGETLWQSELGYQVGSQGGGFYVNASTAILPGIALEVRYEGISLTSDRSQFRLQLVSSLGLQQGIRPGDRQLERLRTAGGLSIQPFYDRNNNGKRDRNEEIYTDSSEFLILNNQLVEPWEIEVKGDRFLLPLPPATYCLDLEAAGFPPDFQPSVKSWAVEVVEGSFTPLMIPLQPSYTLAGVVTDSQGNPIAGARVEAFSSDGTSASLSITNTAGVYYLEQLREGSYQLKVNGDGAIEPNTITIEPNSETLLELNLQQLEQ